MAAVLCSLAPAVVVSAAVPELACVAEVPDVASVVVVCWVCWSEHAPKVSAAAKINATVADCFILPS